MSLSWTQATCERCWIAQEWDDVSIRMPVMLSQQLAQVETCAYCGEPTFVGIYKRDNPQNVPFPRAEPEDGD